MRNILAIKLIFALCTIFFVAACSLSPSEVTKVAEEVNDQKAVKAVVLRYSYDATVPFVYKLFLLPISMDDTAELSDDYLIMKFDERNKRTWSISWSKPNQLDVNCIEGNIYSFQNKSFVSEEQYSVNLNTNCNYK